MLILLRLIIFYYIVTISFCNIEKATENPQITSCSSEAKSSKSVYSNEEVASYARGATYAPSAVVGPHGHETGTIFLEANAEG